MMPPASTALPIDTDIDQLMRSLSDSVDTSHVSNEDIDKLLGSINVNFPSDMQLLVTNNTSCPDKMPTHPMQTRL
ncbi:hypothetical protein GGI11_003520 [Coemansia sp. RSA 2049]|nr:hypothetical protein GGI11_003520 [Coemansia sp. RSA 2049]